jgi:hypothetical protein
MCIPIARQRLGKHVPAVNASTIERLFSMWSALRPLLCNGAVEAVFSVWSMMRSYLEDSWRYRPVEGSAVDCYPLGNLSRRISIAKIRYKETTNEDIAEE